MKNKSSSLNVLGSSGGYSYIEFNGKVRIINNATGSEMVRQSKDYMITLANNEAGHRWYELIKAKIDRSKYRITKIYRKHKGGSRNQWMEISAKPGEIKYSVNGWCRKEWADRFDVYLRNR